MGTPTGASGQQQRRRIFAAIRGASKRQQSQEAEDDLAEPPLWKRALLLLGALALAAVMSTAIVSLSAAVKSSFGTSTRSSPRASGTASGLRAGATPAAQPVASAAFVVDDYVPRQKLQPARFLTLVASRNMKAVEAFDNEMSDVVLFDYSSDASTNCSWCVYVQHMPGVKWELLVSSFPLFSRWLLSLHVAAPRFASMNGPYPCVAAQQEAFLTSDWWETNKNNYKWMWYPDDDLVFKPGGSRAWKTARQGGRSGLSIALAFSV